jgi:integrase
VTGAQVSQFGHGVTVAARADGRLRVRWHDPPQLRTVDTRQEASFPPGRAEDAYALARELATGFALATPGRAGMLARSRASWWQVADRWLTIKTTDWSGDQPETNRQLLVKWAVPVLAEVPISEVRTEHYQQLFATMAAAGSLGSRNRVRALLAQLERWAADNGYREHRSFPIRSFPRTSGRDPHTARTVGTDEQYVPPQLRPDPRRVAALRHAVTQVGRRPAWWRALHCDLAAHAGLRLGETFALRTCHLDLDALTIAVNWQYTQTRADPTLHKRPKNGRVRTAMFPASIRTELAHHLDQLTPHPDEPACVDCLDPACALLFPAPSGGPHTRSLFGRWIARPAYQHTQTDPDPHARWPRTPQGGWLWTWHSLRHHAAVQLLDVHQLAVGDVAQLLGHSEDVLMKRYYGPTDGLLARAHATFATR